MSDKEADNIENDPIKDYSAEELQELINHFKKEKLFGMVKRYERFLQEKLKNS
jgi:ADP-dependent phosphofructokinase/glucokinase